MKKILSIFFILLMTLLNTSCSKGNLKDQILNYNLPSEPKSLDPQISDDYSSNIILVNIFEGLTRLDENDNVIPGVAETFESENNNTLFTFHLRKNTFWSDENKTPVTANDFLFGFKRAIDKNTQAPFVSSLFCIKNAKKINSGQLDISNLGVKVIDDYTLKIELEYPNEDFLKITSTLITMPCNEEFFNSSNGQYGLELKTILGNGPFKFKNKYGWDHFHNINLVKNENYQGNTLPSINGINFEIGKEMTNTIGKLKNNLLDAALINNSEVNLAKKENMNLVAAEDTLLALTFNLSDAMYSNSNIRKGILSSINRELATSNIPDECTIANNLTLNDLKVNGSKFINNYGDELFIKESSEAKNLLNLGLKELKASELKGTNILCLDEPKTKATVSNIIESLNKNLKINFNMTPLEKNDLISRINSKNFQIALAPTILEDDSAFDFFNTFTSSSKKNTVSLNDQYYDKLLTQAYNSNDKNITIEILSLAEKYLNEKAIIYPIYKEKKYFACSKNVSGILFYKYKNGVDFLHTKKI